MSEAKQVQYLQSNGRQYIDTGILINSNNRIELEYALVRATSADTKFVGVNESPYMYCGTYSDKTRYSINGDIIQVNQDTNRHVVKISTDLVVDGVTRASNKTYSFNYNCYIFNANKENFSASGGASIRLYYFKIYNSNNELVLDLKPYIDANGIACLYDTVSQTYFYNQGTGIFLYAEIGEEEIIPVMTANSMINTDGIYEASASSQYNTSFVPYYAFNNNISKSWSKGSNLPQWLKIKLPIAKAISAYELLGNSTSTTESPKIWVIQGSNNDTDWTDLDSQNTTVLKNGAITRFNLATPSDKYLYYRIYITGSNSSNYCDISHFQLLKAPFTCAETIQPYQVQYLQSNGRQYIDTGILMNSNNRIELEYALVNTTSTSTLYNFVGVNESPYVCCGTYSGKTKYSFNGDVIQVNQDTNRHVVKISTDLVVDGVTRASDKTYSFNYNCYIFNANKENFSASGGASIRLYYFKIYNSNNELVLDLKPYIDANGIACLYDTVSQTYFYNQGTGIFLYAEIGGEEIIPLMTANSMTNADGTYEASASSQYSTYFVPYYAFNNTSVSWAKGSNLPQWLKIKLPIAKAISAYELLGNSTSTTQSPKAWVIQGSNNDTDWTDLDSQNTEVLKNGVITRFNLATPSDKYLYYRIYITGSNSDLYCNISHFQLFKAPLPDIKYLFKKNNIYYTIQDQTFTQLSITGLTAQAFTDHGCTGDVIPAFVNQLQGATIYSWTNGTTLDLSANITVNPSEKTIITQNINISNKTLVAFETLATGNPKFLFSADNGTTWKKWNTTSTNWEEATTGNTVNEVNAINNFSIFTTQIKVKISINIGDIIEKFKVYVKGE